MTVHEWGVEYEYLLTCLCDKLDMAKQKSFLSFSLDAHKASVNTSDAVYRHYYIFGKSNLMASVKHLCHQVCMFSTNVLFCHHVACCVDEINLSHVFSLLRIDELLERSPSSLSATERSVCMCCVVGELEAVKLDFERAQTASKESVMSKRKGKERRGRKDQSYREVLSSKADEDREGRVAAYHRSTLTFISSLLNALYRLVVDTGRDRATYLKEAFVSPPINPPRRDFDNRENEAHQQQDPLLALHFKSSSDSTRPSASPLPSTVPLSLRLHSSYCRGDSQFEQLLQCGSLLSLWRRVPPTSIHPIHRKLMHPAAIPPLW
eukprot:GHVN01010685.1.p1 GENE.GHVN01010685.1~~GHVN01010685.1.p1  ORF type:complete len:321 (+),score=65.29 GHVN01010685.1:103-1065(+)